MSSTSKHVEKAEKYVQKGKLGDALEKYLLAFREDPSNDGLVELIAELYVRLNQPNKAMECCGYLFDKRVEQNDGRAALLMFRKMARLGPPDPGRLLICARLLEKQKPVEARDAYQQCAQLLEQKGDRAKALEALRGLAALDDRAEVHVRVAEAAEALGQKELAAQSFLHAGQLLVSGLPSPHQADSLEPAIALLEGARQLAPGDERVAMALAAALLDAGKAGEAEEALRPFAGQPSPQRNRLLAAACLAQAKTAKAEELLWQVAPGFPDAFSDLLRVLEAHLQAGDQPAALSLFYRLRSAMSQVKKESQLAEWVDRWQQQPAITLPVLEFLASAFRELNREDGLREMTARLFDAWVEAGEFAKAAAALDRLVNLGTPEEENQRRLEKLAGKLDEPTWRNLAGRIQPQEAALAAAADQPGMGFAAAPGEPRVGELDDMMLQAEMLLQFAGKEQSAEYLRGIAQRFPGEDARNQRLRGLYQQAGLPFAAAAAPAADLQRVSEITLNIQRQTTIKGALSSAVNEVGRTWGTSRCLAALCRPGKTPTAAMEFCAPGIRPSDGASVARLVTTLVQAAADGHPRAIEDAAAAPELARLTAVVQSLDIRSLLVLPLVAEQTVGLMLLQQCDRQRRWLPGDVVVLKSIADRVVLTTTQIKLQTLVSTVSDARSGLLSRSAYLDCLVTDCEQARRQNAPLSAALLHFSSGGPHGGEAAEEKFERSLQQAIQELMPHLRESNIGARYDSATVALAFQRTRGPEMLAAVEKIRKLLAAAGETRSTLTITAGVAEAIICARADAVDTVTELINRLEAALEAAQVQPGSTRLLPAPVLAAPSR